MRKIYLVLFLLSLFFAAAYSDENKSEIMYFNVTAGQEFEITLKSNPTTGYVWIIDNLNDIKKLVFVSDDFVNASNNQDASGKTIAGAAGEQVFTFKAAENSSGKESLRFLYKRSWEESAVQEKTAEITIK